MRNRTRTLLAGSMLAVGLVAFAPHASAQEEGESEFADEQIEEITHEAETLAEENGGTEADAECIAILIEGGSVDDCHEAPSPILPATDELVWGTISFVLLFLLMWKFAFPAIKKGMNDRTERIRADLDAADTAKTEATVVLDGYKAQLADAKAEAGRIIEEARQAADALEEGPGGPPADRAGRDPGPRRGRHRGRQGPGHRRPPGRARHAGRRRRIGRRQQEPRPGRPDAAHRGLHQPGRDLPMTDDRSHAYAEALLAVARSEGNLAEVEDELFRFARLLEANDDLRTTLTDAALPVSRRQQIVEDLLGGRANPTTTALVSMVVGTGRSRDLPAIIDELVKLSAAEGNREVAEVRSAVDLTDDQKQRLAAALEAKTGKKVELKVIIDPTVLGGLVAQVGDTVIDGSVKTRLQQLKTAF